MVYRVGQCGRSLAQRDSSFSHETFQAPFNWRNWGWAVSFHHFRGSGPVISEGRSTVKSSSCLDYFWASEPCLWWLMTDLASLLIPISKLDFLTSSGFKFFLVISKNGGSSLTPLLAMQRHTKMLVAQSCPTLCDPMDCSLPGSCVHGIPQVRILE